MRFVVCGGGIEKSKVMVTRGVERDGLSVR